MNRVRRAMTFEESLMPLPLDAAQPAVRAAAFAIAALCSLGWSAAAQPAGSAPPSAPATVPPAAGPVDQGVEGESLSELAQALREGSETLTADQVAAIAVKTSPNVRSAQAANERARRAASEALVAVYPRLDLEARYTRLSERDIGFLPDAFMSPDFDFEPPPNQYLLQARLSYPVSDVLLQILPRYRAAQESAEAQALNAQAVAANVALQAREAFYNYARARAALLVARAAVAQTEAQRRDVAALVGAGTLARVEQMRADAQVATTQVALARAQGAVAIARTVLRTLLHRPGDGDIALTEQFGQPLPPLTEGKEQLLARATRERKEVLALRTMIKAHEYRARAENSNKLPKLAVAGTFDYANPNSAVDPYEEEWGEAWAVIGAITWSPNDFASGGARAAQAEADRAQAQADLHALEDALRQEIAQGFEDYEAARQAMESALTGIRAAEESYRVRREQFRAGAAVATDVIDAESELRRARLELINAAIDVRIARARLDRAVGRGQPG
jgi:outer membrane protein